MATAGAAWTPPPSADWGEPSYRFVPGGSGSGVSVRPLGSGDVGVLGFDGRRVVHHDGLVENGPVSRLGLMGAVPVPPRMGGGFLFWSHNALYRARTFLGALEPVAPLATNAITVALGHDSILVYEPNGRRTAYGLEGGGRVPMSPRGVVDIAGADDDRVVATDVTGRALASIDGGKSWKDVGADLNARVTRLHGEPDRVGFELNGREMAWLQKDGQLARELAGDPRKPAAGAEAEAASLLYSAVLSGVPLPGGRAFFARGTDVVVVDLQTGEVAPPRTVAAKGQTCTAWSADDEGLVACTQYAKKASMTVISHVLGGEPRIEKTIDGVVPVAYAAGALVVASDCEGNLLNAPDAGRPRSPAQLQMPWVPGLVCARRAGGTWTPYDIRPILEPGALVAAWIPREDGGLTAIALNKGSPSSPSRPILIDAAHGVATPLDDSIDRIDATSPTAWARGWAIARDGSLRGFASKTSVAVDPRGHVTRGARAFALISVGDAMHAMARDASHALWQTTDSGAHWVQVARPPLDEASSSAAIREISGTDPTPVIRCSALGCVIAHPSGVGSWVRVGWPLAAPEVRAVVDAASPQVAAAASDAGAASPVPEAPAPPSASPPVLPKLRCALRSEPTPSRADDAPKKAAGDQWQPAFGGRSLLKSRGDQSYVTTLFRDHFPGPGDDTADFLGFGLRGVAHYATPAKEPREAGLTALLESKAPIESLFVETFDPSGRVLRATGSFASWPAHPATGSVPIGDMLHGIEPATRPVLSTQPGHADGVLFQQGPLAFWASRIGTIRPVAKVDGRCSLTGAYRDPKGKLLVVCGTSEGAATISDAETGELVMRFSPVITFMGHVEQKVASFPSAPWHVFANPDAIAVAPDGKLGLVRIPSVSVPAPPDDPAWFLTKDAQPVELAPWSTLRLASSPECMHDPSGYRAIVQTAVPWVAVEGSLGFWRTPGMTALVRWSPSHVCLEAVEVGYREIKEEHDPQYGLKVMAVARFVGAGAGGGLVGASAEDEVRAPATCTLE